MTIKRWLLVGIAATAAVVGTVPTALAAGADTPTITLSGRVTDAGTGLPVAGVSVDIISVQNGFAGPGPQEAGFASTATDGTWSVSGLATPVAPGFWVCFSTSPFGYAGPDYYWQCWKDAPGYAGIGGGSGYAFVSPGATTIPVTAGQTVTGIDAHLQRVPHETYSGRVTAADTGAPLDGVKVSVVTPSDVGRQYRGFGATTAADGTYSVTESLPPGTQAYLCFSTLLTPDAGYANQCWSAAKWTALNSVTMPPAPGATPIPVSDGAALGGFDATLPRLTATGLAAGTVRATNGQPLAGVTVSVFAETTGDPLVASTRTAADGSYRAVVANNAFYRVCFSGTHITGGPSDALGYLPSCHGLASWTPPNPPTSADAVLADVVVEDATTGIDGVLRPAGAISGAVTQVGFNARLRNVSVDVFDSTGVLAATGVTLTDGTYRITGLVPGTYRVCFDGRTAKGGYTLHWYSSQCWSYVAWTPGGSVPVKATAAAAVSGQTTAGIDARLAAA